MTKGRSESAVSVPAIAALVPMKAHSERVSGKNIRPLCGQPLFFWILNALQQSRYVTRIAVDTDSPRIASMVSALFDVTIIDRPDELLGDMVVANQLIAYDMQQLPEFDYFLQTHSTNPLILPSTLDHAIESYFQQKEHDALFSVTALQTRLYSQGGAPLNHDPYDLLRTQDLDVLYEENSCFYLFSRQAFQKKENRLGATPMLFPIDASEAVDIDDEFDFLIAQALMEMRLKDEGAEKR